MLRYSISAFRLKRICFNTKAMDRYSCSLDPTSFTLVLSKSEETTFILQSVDLKTQWFHRMAFKTRIQYEERDLSSMNSKRALTHKAAKRPVRVSNAFKRSMSDDI